MEDRKYKAVIFDLDGTLLNTLEDLKDSVNYALRKHEMKERSLEEIRQFVGNGVRRLMERAVPADTSREAFDKIFTTFKEYYVEHCNDKTKPYPGILELLAALDKRGYQMAIVSNKLQSGVDALRELYFGKYITIAIGGKEGIPGKPAPDMVLEALKLLNISKEKGIYVGDSEVDIETAVNTGMDCITVTWGFRTRQEQEKAGGRLFVDAPMEILGLL